MSIAKHPKAIIAPRSARAGRRERRVARLGGNGLSRPTLEEHYGPSFACECAHMGARGERSAVRMAIFNRK